MTAREDIYKATEPRKPTRTDATDVYEIEAGTVLNALGITGNAKTSLSVLAPRRPGDGPVLVIKVQRTEDGQ